MTHQQLAAMRKRQDVEDMIWEVDEDQHGLISWDEFKAMFPQARQIRMGGRASSMSWNS